jgi:molybdopterin synthase sulfur carrier subunit
VKVKVLFFAALREQLGVASDEVELPGEISSVGDLRARLAARGEPWSNALAEGKLLRCAINQDMASPSSPVRPGDEIAFFPPVTGG